MDYQNDVRWEQRFANFNKALAQLKKFIDHGQLNEFEEQGLLQAFEYTYELAWNVARDYLRNQGNGDVHGSRDTIREAFAIDIISDGETWMNMLRDRNLTVHSYNENVAREIAHNISTFYFPLLVSFQEKMLSMVNRI